MQRSHLCLANWLGRLGRNCLALSIFATILVYSPQSVLANALEDVRTGNELFRARQLDEAIEAFTRAVTSGDLQPETLAITYNNRGVALGELGEFDRAIEDYEKALQLLPSDPTTAKNLRVAHLRRGLAAQERGEFDVASTDLDAAIEAQPDHYLAYLRRAELNVLRGNLALAVNDYKLALARRPGDSELISALNQARQALSQPVETQTANEQSDQPAAEIEAAATDPAPIAPSTDNVAQADPSPEPEAVADPEPLPVVRASDPAPVSSETSDSTEPGEQDASTRLAEESTQASQPPTTTTEIAAIEPSAGGPFVRTLAAVNVRDAAANAGNLVTTLAEGVVLPVLGEELGWKRIRLNDGREGFIYQRWVEDIPQP